MRRLQALQRRWARGPCAPTSRRRRRGSSTATWTRAWWCSARRTRPNGATTAPPSRRCSGRPSIRGRRRSPLVGRAGDRLPRWPRALCPRRREATAPARSGCPRRAAASSALNLAAAEVRSPPGPATRSRVWSTHTHSPAPCGTARHCSMSSQVARPATPTPHRRRRPGTPTRSLKNLPHNAFCWRPPRRSLGSPTDPAVAAAVENTGQLLGDIGHIVEPGSPTIDPDVVADAIAVLHTVSNVALHALATSHLGRRARRRRIRAEHVGDGS